MLENAHVPALKRLHALSQEIPIMKLIAEIVKKELRAAQTNTGEWPQRGETTKDRRDRKEGEKRGGKGRRGERGEREERREERGAFGFVGADFFCDTFFFVGREMENKCLLTAFLGLTSVRYYYSCVFSLFYYITRCLFRSNFFFHFFFRFSLLSTRMRLTTALFCPTTQTQTELKSS